MKLRIMAKGPQRVFARGSGVVTMLARTDPRCDQRPDGDMVGSYNSRASVIDIEADLVERLREISA